jgi:hypothetical protein
MTTSPPLRGTAGTAATPTPHKTIRSFFRETEDDIIDDPPTTNSNNTQNENTPTQPIPKTIGNNEKNQTNIHRPLQAGEATHTPILQHGYNPLNVSPVPVNSHKSIGPTTPNTLHKRKLHQVTPTIMAPLSNQTTTNFLKVCNAYNALNGQSTDGKLTIEKLEMILVCLKNVGEYHYIDLTIDTPDIPEQQRQTVTVNREVKNEPTPNQRSGATKPRALFGNNNPEQAHTNEAIAAKDPTRSTTEQPSTRSDAQEEQEYADALENSLGDGTKVTPGNDNSTSGTKKRDRDTHGPNRNSYQLTLGNIPQPITACYPRYTECKSVTDQVMTGWVKSKYPLFNKEISLHCTADDNKRTALNLMAALVGKTFPNNSIKVLLEVNATNTDQLPLIDLFQLAGLDEVVLAQDYCQLQLSLQHDRTICGLLQGSNSNAFDGVPTAHAILCAFRAKATGAPRFMYRYVVFIPLLNAILTPRGINEVPNRRPNIHCWVLGTAAHKALEQQESTTIDTIIGGKIFPGNDKVKALKLMSAVIVQDLLHK